MTDIYQPGHSVRQWETEDRLDFLYRLLEPPAWHAEAACRDQGNALFFPERGQRAAGAEALRFCAVCPVIKQCRAASLVRSDTHGIWGGLTEVERRKVRRRHPPPRAWDSDPMSIGLAGHDSEAGYHRHMRLKEEPCEACIAAHNRYRNPTDAPRGGRRPRYGW